MQGSCCALSASPVLRFSRLFRRMLYHSLVCVWTVGAEGAEGAAPSATRTRIELSRLEAKTMRLSTKTDRAVLNGFAQVLTRRAARRWATREAVYEGIMTGVGKDGNVDQQPSNFNTSRRGERRTTEYSERRVQGGNGKHPGRRELATSAAMPLCCRAGMGRKRKKEKDKESAGKCFACRMIFFWPVAAVLGLARPCASGPVSTEPVSPQGHSTAHPGGHLLLHPLYIY